LHTKTNGGNGQSDDFSDEAVHGAGTIGKQLDAETGADGAEQLLVVLRADHHVGDFGRRDIVNVTIEQRYAVRLARFTSRVEQIKLQ
jgi:hypothetical protein